MFDVHTNLKESVKLFCKPCQNGTVQHKLIVNKLKMDWKCLTGLCRTLKTQFYGIAVFGIDSK